MVDAEVGPQEQLGGGGDAATGEVARRGLADGFAENQDEIVFAEVAKFGEMGVGDWRRQVVLHVVQRRLYRLERRDAVGKALILIRWYDGKTGAQGRVDRAQRQDSQGSGRGIWSAQNLSALFNWGRYRGRFRHLERSRKQFSEGGRGNAFNGEVDEELVEPRVAVTGQGQARRYQVNGPALHKVSGSRGCQNAPGTVVPVESPNRVVEGRVVPMTGAQFVHLDDEKPHGQGCQRGTEFFGGSQVPG